MSEYSNIQDAAKTRVKGLNAYEGEIPLVFILIHLQILVKNQLSLCRSALTNTACLIDENLLFSLLSIPPATRCSTICSICVQRYSPVTQRWEGGFWLRSTLWQPCGVEVTCSKSSLFTASVFIFKYINFKNKSDRRFEGEKNSLISLKFTIKAFIGCLRKCN